MVSPARLRRHSSKNCAQSAARSRCETQWRLAKKAFRTTADYDARHQRAPGAGGRRRRPLPADARHARAQADGPALRRESAPVGGALWHAAARESPAPSSCTARSFPTTTWWIWTRPGNWSASSTRPPRPSSSTPIPAAARSRRTLAESLSQGVRVRSGLGVRRRDRRSIAPSMKRPRARSPRRLSKPSPRRTIRPKRWRSCGAKKNLRLMRVAAGAGPAGGEIDLRRLPGADRRRRTAGPRRGAGEDPARADRRGMDGAGIRLEGGQAREVERHRVRARRGRRSASARGR